MRVWQPGSHLTVERGQAPTAGHGWKRTRRRLLALARLAKPYKGRVALALGFLLIATLAALAPPYLAKLAIDDGIAKGDLTALGWIVAAFVATGLVYLGANAAQTYFTGLDGRARPRRPPQRPLPPPPAPLARLLRAQPRRRHHQPADERHRRARPARHGGRHVTAQEHAAAARLGHHPLHSRLAARARHADGDAGAHRRDRDVPLPLHDRLSRRARAPRPRDGDARRGHRRHARPPVVHARGPGDDELRGGQRQLPPGEPPHGRPQRRLLPDRRLPLHRGHRDRARLRRLPRLGRRHDDRHAVRLHRLPRELLRPRAGPVAVLQHIPLRDGCARQDHGGARGGARGGRRAGRPAPPPHLRDMSASSRSGSATATGRRSSTASSSTYRRGRRSPSSATPAPASRRSPSSSPASTTRGRAGSRSTATTSAR